MNETFADGTGAGPVSGEDDLEPFMIRWAPASRPELDYYNGWNLTLVVHGPGVQLWSNPDKTGPQVLQEYPPGWGVSWVIGVDPIPSTLYLEALSATTPGGIQLDLLLTSPQWGPTDGDVVVFTALPLPTVDLDTDSDNNHVLEESDLEDQDEATRPHPIGIPGKIILRNHDDDNGNTIQDRLDPSPFVDGSGNPVMDNELVPIKLKVAANGNDLSDFTVTLIPSGQEIRVWKTQDKQPTALTFSLVTMPAQLYVEGYDYGLATLEMVLKDPGGGIVSSDVIKFTVLNVDAIAYRPDTIPFTPWPVPFQEEQTPGVGIRRNGDDDDGSGAPDNTETGVVAENDLIRVDLHIGIGGLPPGVAATVSRGSRDINVWRTSTKSFSQALLTPDTDDSASFDIPLSSTTVYVEWASLGGGSSTFEFAVWDRLHGRKVYFDDIVFKPFQSVVIVLGGEFQTPADPVQFPGNQGMFQFAIDEYRQSGLDVHMYNEDDVGYNGIGDVYDEVVSAINDRGVTDVAIMGYSHGGGSTYVLAWRLQQNTIPGSGISDITKPFSIPFTGYIDAIDDGGPAFTAETRRPPMSLFHCAQYQDNNAPSGAPSGGDDDFNRTYLGVTHQTIDDHAVVLELLRTRLRQKVAP